MCDTTNIYTTLYNNNKDIFAASDPEFITKLRSDAMKFISENGFPAKKDEQYKYSFLEPHFGNGYKRYLAPKAIEFDVSHLFRCDVPALDTHVIILVNGFYFDKVNTLRTHENGIVIGSLNEAIKKYPALIEKYLAKSYSNTDSYVAINTAFASDGVFLYVPKNQQLEKPIQIINVLLSDEELMVQHRNLFILEPNSSAKVVVCDHTLSPVKFLTNSVNEIFAGENAHFDYFKVQNEHNDSVHVSHSFINQDTASNCRSTTITLHGGVVRNNLSVKFNGEGCENHAFGLFVSDQNQHVDNNLFIDHAKPNCTSNQQFKAILDDASTGAFTGRILVERDAQKTAAYQRNSSILLTDEARMNSKPQLEIYADDVKCSHGATVGQLDEEALFYLRSRGISEREARLMLMYAFAFEILNEIKIEPLKDRMSELIEKRLRGELSRCNNCAMHCS